MEPAPGPGGHLGAKSLSQRIEGFHERTDDRSAPGGVIVEPAADVFAEQRGRQSRGTACKQGGAITAEADLDHSPSPAREIDVEDRRANPVGLHESVPRAQGSDRLRETRIPRESIESLLALAQGLEQGRKARLGPE